MLMSSRALMTSPGRPVAIHFQRSLRTGSLRSGRANTSSYNEQEFRVLELIPKKQDRAAQSRTPGYRMNIPGPRADRMATDQDWTAVWPAARMFHPAVVPLPVHMGFVKRPELYMPPGKFANAELMKIPNFLHLTPPAIKKHCEAIKKFCTKWPEELKTDEDCHKAFPLEFECSDYVHAAPTIRDPRSRIVTLRFKMSDLKLNYHARDKLRRLLSANETKRWNEKNDIVTINADRCPLKRQNYEYIQYLLTALYFEAWKKEQWEDQITKEDWERYYWDRSSSKASIVDYYKQVSPKDVRDEGDVIKKDEVKNYAAAVTNLYDKGESDETVDEYKRSVLKILFNKSEVKL